MVNKIFKKSPEAHLANKIISKKRIIRSEKRAKCVAVKMGATVFRLTIQRIRFVLHLFYI